MDQNSMPPGGASDRPPEENAPQEQEQGQPLNPPPGDQSPPSYVPPPQDYTPQIGQPTQAQPQSPYTPPPPYSQPPQGMPPQGSPPPGYPPQGYPQGTPPPGYAPQPGYPPQGYPPQNYGLPPKKSGMPVWGWILIAVGILAVLICGVGIVGLTLLGRQVSNTFSKIGPAIDEGGLGQMGIALDFYGSLESHDYDAAHDLLATQLAEKYTVDQLRTRWEALETASGKVTAGFPDTSSVGDNQGSITEELTTEQGKTYTIKLTVEKTDLLWKITGADPDLIPSP